MSSSISRAQSVRRSLPRVRGFRRHFRLWIMGKAPIHTWLRFPRQLQYNDHHLLLNHLFYHHSCPGEQNRMWPLRVLIARRRIWPVTVRLPFYFIYFDNFLGSFYFRVLFGFIPLFYGCPSAGNMCFNERGSHFFRSWRSAGLSFWHELYFFWAARFRHMSYYPGMGCRRLPHGFIR